MSRTPPQAVAAVEAFEEWLLCDAPAAARERARRRGDHAARVERERAQVAAWCRRTLDNAAAPVQLRDLAEAMTRLVARGAASDLAHARLPDEEWVRRERRRYEASRQVAGDDNYRYPARYLGTAAPDQPIPDERVPVTGLEPGQRVRLGPSAPPEVVAALEACGDHLLVCTADGQRRRYPATAWLYRVHDERFMSDAARDLAEVPAQRLPHDRSDLGIDR